MKDLTGQDTLSARYMRAEWFDFVPVCKIWLGTNHRPEIRGTDKAIWDRVRLIPFNVRIPDATDTSVPEDQRADPLLLGKLKAELPGILAWAVEGCNLWQRERLGWPTAIREATERYRADMDLIGDFLTECCVIDRYASVPVGGLYERYQTWAVESGEKASGKRTFSQTMSERGFVQIKKTGGRRYWEGIGFPTDTEDLISGKSGKSGAGNGINKAAQNYAGGIAKTTPLPPLLPLFICRTCSGTRSWTRSNGEQVCTDCGAMLPLFSAGDWVQPAVTVKSPSWARAQVQGDAGQYSYTFKREIPSADGTKAYTDETWPMWWYELDGTTTRLPEIDLACVDSGPGGE